MDRTGPKEYPAPGIARLRAQAEVRAAARRELPAHDEMAYGTAQTAALRVTYRRWADGLVVCPTPARGDAALTGFRQSDLVSEMRFDQVCFDWSATEIGSAYSRAAFAGSLTIRAEGSYTFGGSYVNLGDGPSSSPLHAFSVAAVIAGRAGAALSFAVRGRDIPSIPSTWSRTPWKLDGWDAAIAEYWPVLTTEHAAVLSAANTTVPGKRVNAIGAAFRKVKRAGCPAVTLIPIVAHRARG